jgi:hypothetical protein
MFDFILIFQIAKAKAESRIECLKNGDGNGIHIFYLKIYRNLDLGVIKFFIKL